MLADDEPGASEPVADDEIEAEHEQQQREGRLQEAVDRARNPAQPEQSHHFEDTEYVCVEGGGCVEGVEGVVRQASHHVDGEAGAEIVAARVSNLLGVHQGISRILYLDF